jgi:hypothetical protein
MEATRQIKFLLKNTVRFRNILKVYLYLYRSYCRIRVLRVQQAMKINRTHKTENASLHIVTQKVNALQEKITSFVFYL